MSVFLASRIKELSGLDEIRRVVCLNKFRFSDIGWTLPRSAKSW